MSVAGHTRARQSQGALDGRETDGFAVVTKRQLFGSFEVVA